MFTRCPECQAVHEVHAADLAQSRGQVRCGTCDHEFDSLGTLSDRRPGTGHSQDSPPAGSKPPRLTGASAEFRTRDFSQDKPSAGNSRPWKILLGLLLLITVAHLAWTFREPLLQQPLIRKQLVSTGWVEPIHRPPFKDVARIQLVSRDMHAHPTRAGMLVLSVTFVNRAAEAQAWPFLELKLLDSSSRILATRVFEPAEYLGNRPGLPGYLVPDVHVPVLLEFADPGNLATGFEIVFH